jgi:hypothetical protein
MVLVHAAGGAVVVAWSAVTWAAGVLGAGGDVTGTGGVCRGEAEVYSPRMWRRGGGAAEPSDRGLLNQHAVPGCWLLAAGQWCADTGLMQS